MKVNPPSTQRAHHDPLWVRWTLTALALFLLTILVIVPIVHVFYVAFSNGISTYWSALIDDADTRNAILTTLIVAPAAVFANLIFGVAAAWLIARYQFPGRALLLTMIDIPFSVSPVVAGLIFVLIFGRQGYIGPWFEEHFFKVIFATPGLILVTTFVTLPFVARELIPIMEAIGPDEELAAMSLGANLWQTLWNVTLPNIKWGVLYGVILCNARAMGEFGAANVVCGRVRGRATTIPLRVEQLFQDSHQAESFAVASILTLLALVTLIIKVFLQRRATARFHESQALSVPSE